MSQLFVNLSRKASAQWILEADIKGVSTISVTTGWSAMSLWTKQSLEVVESWRGISGQFQATDAGTPQGHHFPDLGQRGAERAGTTTGRSLGQSWE
jgi:RNA-directed DNA polymerase